MHLCNISGLNYPQESEKKKTNRPPSRVFLHIRSERLAAEELFPLQQHARWLESKSDLMFLITSLKYEA